MVQLLHGKSTLGLVLLSLSCLPSSTMVATAHPLDSIIGHIRTLADSYIPTNPIRSSRTVSHQQDVLQDSYGQNDIKDSLAQTGAAVDSLLPSATATKTVAIVPIATPTSLFEDIYEDEEDDVSYASSTSTSSSDPFIDSSISRRRVRSKRQNSGVGNVGNGNSGNYNCGNGNSGSYNNGNGNSGNYNSGNGQSGNGNGAGGCGVVSVGQSVAYVYPAPSTVIVAPQQVTTQVIVQNPYIYTSVYVYQQPAVTTVVQQPYQVVPIVTSETTLPKGCAYWTQLGYRCSAGGSMSREMSRAIWAWTGAMGVFWAVIISRFM